MDSCKESESSAGAECWDETTGAQAHTEAEDVTVVASGVKSDPDQYPLGPHQVTVAKSGEAPNYRGMKVSNALSRKLNHRNDPKNTKVSPFSIKYEYEKDPFLAVNHQERPLFKKLASYERLKARLCAALHERAHMSAEEHDKE